MVSPSAMNKNSTLHASHSTLKRGTDGNRFSDEGRKILAQYKKLQPQEYFVYFKDGIPMDCGKRSGIH